jgi:ribosome biogenesis GTPase / thiamine phosphate phosphatase
MDVSQSYDGSLGQEPAELWGLVTAVQANYYWVKLEAEGSQVGEPPGEVGDPNGGGVDPLPPYLLCTRRARLKKIGQQVMVGDRVRVEEPDWEGRRGAIAAVATRQTVLDRPPIANANQILLMFALAEPDLDPQQLTRFLVKAEATGLAVVLCLNKQDLVSPQHRQNWQNRLHHWGYTPVVMSVQTDSALTRLHQHLQGRITVVSGPSGVGKSSLINQLVPQATLRTGTVSGKLGRGRHTTRHIELFELPGGGFLADTPGFNQPDLQAAPEQLGDYFPEIRQQLAQNPCQFSNCLHRDEPGCAVGQGWDRYPLYRDLLEEALARQETLAQRPEAAATLKVKVGDLGQIHHEPLLQAKKYRRVSRRRQKQDLDDLRYGLPDAVEDLEGLDDLEGDLG